MLQLKLSKWGRAMKKVMLGLILGMVLTLYSKCYVEGCKEMCARYLGLLDQNAEEDDTS